MTGATSTAALSTKRNRRWRLAAAVGLAALTVTGAAQGPAASGAPARPQNVNHCVVPSGVDLNALWGVSEQIVTGTSPSCSEVGSGERFRPSVRPWFLNHTFEITPAGFKPAGATPLADFVAKLAAVRYVIDPGTRQARSYLFTNDGNLATTTSFGLPVVNPLTLGAVGPLRVGSHEIETYWSFDALHCDGLGADTGPGGNCFPAGETPLPTMTFEVRPGHF
jgi:hypothetical protein